MRSGLDAAIESVVDQFLAATPVAPAACVAFDGPDGRGVVSRGVAEMATCTPMTGSHAVRIASCTKPFVASTVLELAARGLVELDQPAIEVAPSDVVSLLAAHDYGPVITVRHLLQHRSGLVDHTETPEFGEIRRASNHTHEWTALSQLELSIRRPSLFEPGAAWSYSDSGYVLLGQIIEQLTSSPLAEAVRRSCRLDELGLSSIHWEREETVPRGLVRAHQYRSGDDTYDWNPTLDLFGGGGLVATMPDLARWWSALFEGDVHDHLARQIGDPEPAVSHDGTDHGKRVGLGMFLTELEGAEFWEHSGYWGLYTLHIPSVRTSVAIVVTARDDAVPSGKLVGDVVRTLIA